MATVELTEANLNELVENSGTLIIDFWAEWCGPCKSFGPIFEAASERHPDVVFAKCDTETEQKWLRCSKCGHPHGRCVSRALPVSAAGARNALDELLGKIAEANMDDVRAQVAAQQGPLETN